MTTQFSWEKQNTFSWRGTVNNIACWVILTLDGTRFILQVPGMFSHHDGLENMTYSSLDEAQKKAQEIYENS